MAEEFLCSILECGKPARYRGWCRSHYSRWLRHGSPEAGRASKAANGEAQAFVFNVAAKHVGEACLAWPFHRLPNGRWQLRVGRQMKGAHVVVCEMAHGPRPSSDHEAAHSCGKGHEGCVSPHHLRWATHAENEADKVVHGTKSQGESHGQAILSEADVKEILRLKGVLLQREIGEMFGVSKHTIGDIHRGAKWQHIAR